MRRCSRGAIDIAVHSLKDLPTRLPPGIAFVCIPDRGDPRDAFVSPVAPRLEDLPTWAIVGTASLRRQAQSLFARPDLKVETMRGNVDTRLAKLARGEAHATFLAVAGLTRLGLTQHITSYVDPVACPPAPCQGALAITVREDDHAARDAVAKIQQATAWVECAAERAFLTALDGSCRTPIAAMARCDGRGHLQFVGEALRPDGRARFRREGVILEGADEAQAAALGRSLGAAIAAEAGDQLMVDL